jgi:peptide/nickel transport system substrate-binding protein
VTVLYSGDVAIFSPTWDDSPKFLLFLPLVNYERGAYCGEPTGVLAERWEHSADYREWTVFLRDGVRWHDGQAFSAEDVAFTIDVLTHPEVLNYNAGTVDSAAVVDPLTVRLFMSEPSRWPLEGWQTFIPKHLLEDEDPAEFHDWEFWKNPVGNGPFRFVRDVPQTAIELESNPDYYRGRPEIDRVVIKVTAAGSRSGLLELQSGDTDIVGAELVEASTLARDPRFQIAYRVSTSHSRWLLYHPEHPIFSDPRVRRAMSHALDRSALQAAVGLPEGTPVTDGPYSVCQFQSGTVTDPWPHDRTEAARLFEQAGWTDGDGDGVLDREGHPFRFTLVVSDRDVRSAVLLQAELRQIGIEMEVDRTDGSLAVDRLHDGDFEAGIFPAVLPNQLIAPYPARPVSAVFKTAYPEIVALMDSIRVAPDAEDRRRQWLELGNRFRDQLPATYLYPNAYPLAAGQRVRGLEWEDWAPPAWRWPFGGLEFLSVEPGPT